MCQTEKEYRTKLYQEDKEKYKKKRAEFIYGVSQNFRQKRENRKDEMKQLEEETIQADQEGEDGLY